VTGRLYAVDYESPTSASLTTAIGDLGQTAVALKTGASITGRLLAQSAVTLDANTAVAPL
jgi:hypothetical protein